MQNVCRNTILDHSIELALTISHHEMQEAMFLIVLWIRIRSDIQPFNPASFNTSIPILSAQQYTDLLLASTKSVTHTTDFYKTHYNTDMWSWKRSQLTNFDTSGTYCKAAMFLLHTQHTGYASSHTLLLQLCLLHVLTVNGKRTKIVTIMGPSNTHTDTSQRTVVHYNDNTCFRVLGLV